MRQIISGVTPKKNDVYGGNSVLDFLKNEKTSFLNFIDTRVVYDNKVMISSPALNYLNLLPQGGHDLALKNMILKEYHECEKIYPYLGELFLFNFFSHKTKKKGSITMFSRKEQKKLLVSIEDKNVNSIANWILNNTNLGRNIVIQTHNSNDIIFEPEDNFSFKVGYDFDFYKNLADKSYRDYNYIIIDGYIESMGEIHHMLYEASNNKEPYVIFCYGMSEEVKHNIMINNHRGITRVLPVSLDSNDETTLNVLNDIAALHDGDVVSSNLGQTISQEIRKKLKKGKKITFFENSIYLEPVCSDDKIKKHRGFLLNRLADASKKSDVNTDPLKRRIRNFTSKKLNLYLPKILKDDNSFQRELDYFLRMTKYLDKNLEIIDLGFKKNYIVPKILKEYANRKSKSLQKTFDSIKIVIS